MDGSLPGGIHLRAGLHDIAHDDGFHLLGAKLSACNRGADRHRTEGGSRNVLERASKGADCRSKPALRKQPNGAMSWQTPHHGNLTNKCVCTYYWCLEQIRNTCILGV